MILTRAERQQLRRLGARCADTKDWTALIVRVQELMNAAEANAHENRERAQRVDRFLSRFRGQWA